MTPSSSSSKYSDRNVIVVGAGLSGLALSLGLANLGYTVDLVEKRHDFSFQGATFGLRPNGIKALNELCAEAVPPLTNVGVPTPSGGLMLPWSAMRDSLLTQVQKRATQITLRMGLNLQDIVDGNEDESVTATFLETKRNDEDDDPAFVTTLQGCLLVGCDGVNSAVRAHLGLPPAQPCGATLWRSSAVVPSTSKAASLLDQGILPMGMRNHGPCTFAAFNFHSTIPNTMLWSVSTKQTNIAQGTHPWTVLEQYIDNEQDSELIQELFSLSRPEDLLQVWDLRTIDPTSGIVQQQETTEVSSGWGGKGRVTILGDAAHAMRPATGLGGSMAFEDCVVLCRELAAISSAVRAMSLKDPTAAAALISRFEAARLPRVRTIWNDEWERSESVYTGQSKGPPTEEYTKWLHAGV